MKTTQDLFGIDPSQFATMLYPDVLVAKKVAAKERYNTACTESFALPHNRTSLERKGELDIIIKEANKALEHIDMWIEELGLAANYAELLAKAEALCVSAHYGQFRRGPGNVPYHTHSMAVAAMMSTPLERIVALLHDVVEDTETTIQEIQSMFGALVAKYVQALTHEEGVPYMVYIKGVKEFQVTTNVKIGDITHNLASGPSENSKVKYQKAIAVLIR